MKVTVHLMNQGKRDKHKYTCHNGYILLSHEPGNYVFFRSLATWPLSPPPDPEGWRHLRIQLTGANACGHTYYLSISGLEIYGEVRGLADEELGTVVKNYICCCIIQTSYCY